MLRSNMQVDTIKHEEKERDGRGREKIIIGKLEVAQPIISVANLFPWQLLKKCTAWKHRNYDCINHTLFIKWNVHRAQSKQLNIEHESASQPVSRTNESDSETAIQTINEMWSILSIVPEIRLHVQKFPTNWLHWKLQQSAQRQQVVACIERRFPSGSKLKFFRVNTLIVRRLMKKPLISGLRTYPMEEWSELNDKDFGWHRRWHCHE